MGEKKEKKKKKTQGPRPFMQTEGNVIRCACIGHVLPPTVTVSSTGCHRVVRRLLFDISTVTFFLPRFTTTSGS